MAISSYKVTLKYGSSEETLTKLVEIKDFPALGGAPELLETTTLNDAAQTFINGIQSMSAMEFTANYTKADFTTVKATEATPGYYALEFGTSGADGIFEWQGMHSVWVDGAGVNGVVNMKLSIAPSTKVELATA